MNKHDFCRNFDEIAEIELAVAESGRHGQSIHHNQAFLGVDDETGPDECWTDWEVTVRYLMFF